MTFAAWVNGSATKGSGARLQKEIKARAPPDMFVANAQRFIIVVRIPNTYGKPVDHLGVNGRRLLKSVSIRVVF